MEKTYVTITGLHHYFGVKMFERGMDITLCKDLENDFDNEAIEARIDGLGKIGYVANSINTTLGETQSAGRIYDKFEEKINGKVAFVLEDKNAIIVEFSIQTKDTIGKK